MNTQICKCVFFAFLVLIGLRTITANGKNKENDDKSGMTWLPTSYHMDSETSVYNLMADLQKTGVKVVYVDVWNQGKVYFESATMNALLPSGTGFSGKDTLSWALDAAKSLGGDLEVHAWFEYGLIAAYGSINNDFARKATDNQWILGQEGAGFIYMDPENQDVLNFLVGIFSDCWETYSKNGLRSIQLDDHFSSPVSLGRTTQSMTSAMEYVRKGLSKIGATLSLSPSTLDQALNTYNVDWNQWGTLQLFDNVTPQLYRSDFHSFRKAFDDTCDGVSNETKVLWKASGIRVDGSGAPTPWDDVQQSIEYAARKDNGACIWYAHGILELYPTQFQALWTE